MDVIRHQMALLDPALLPSRQIVKHLAQVPLDLPEQQLLAVLRRKHDVVLAPYIPHLDRAVLVGRGPE